MKRKLLLLVMLMITLGAFAGGKAKIEFTDTHHSFGNINAKGGAVTATYEFKNVGDAPLAVIHVTNGGCGCTTPQYPKEPIRPGETGVIKITFNPAGRKGEVNREVKVKSNGGNKSLSFSAVIIP